MVSSRPSAPCSATFRSGVRSLGCWTGLWRSLAAASSRPGSGQFGGARAARWLAAGLRLVVGGVVGVDDALRDAPAVGNLAPAGLGPFADGASLLPARAARASAPRAAPALAGCGSELGQRLLHGCLVLL